MLSPGFLSNAPLYHWLRGFPNTSVLDTLTKATTNLYRKLSICCSQSHSPYMVSPCSCNPCWPQTHIRLPLPPEDWDPRLKVCVTRQTPLTVQLPLPPLPKSMTVSHISSCAPPLDSLTASGQVFLLLVYPDPQAGRPIPDSRPHLCCHCHCHCRCCCCCKG